MTATRCNTYNCNTLQGAKLLGVEDSDCVAQKVGGIHGMKSHNLRCNNATHCNTYDCNTLQEAKLLGVKYSDFVAQEGGIRGRKSHDLHCNTYGCSILQHI